MIQFLRYGAVGLANTATSLAVIAVCLAVGWGDYAANALGYAAGLTLSFFANRRFTFRLGGKVRFAEASGFLASFAIAYAFNLAVIWLGRSAGLAGNPMVHLAGMAVYSLVFYLAMQRLAFRAAGQRADAVARHLPAASLAALALASLVVLIDNPLTHDVVWQFWIARQMLSGAELYRDIWEVNPPLWFWSAMPLEAMAGMTGISPFRYLNALIVAWGALAAWAVLRLADPLSPRARAWLACSVFALAIWTEPFDFAQREQLALIGALPYAALIARRRAGHAVPLAMASAVGLAAAYGFALKHYFALIPLALEAWLFLASRQAEGPRYRMVRPETAILGVSAAAYAAAVWLFTPAFLTEMVPIISLAYGGYEEPVWNWFDEPAQLLWGIAAIALLYSRRADPDARPLETAALLTAGAFFAAYLLQAKGWQYHAMPVSAALLLACAIRMIDARGSVRILLAVPITAALLLGQLHGHYRNYLRHHDEHLLQRAPQGAPVAVFSADPMWAWPIVEENGFVWPMSLYSHWMLPTIARAEIDGTSTPAMRALGDRIRRQAARDLACAPPAIILFERRRRYPVQPKSFDVTGYFLGDAAFASFVSAHYREAARTRQFLVFEQISQPAPATGCRAIAAPRWAVERHDRHGRVAAVIHP